VATLSVKKKLDVLRFSGRMPADALSYPRSSTVRADLRGSLRFAMSSADRYGWPGIDKVHQGWSSKTYDDNKWLEDHQGLVFNGKYWFCSQMGGTIRRCKDDTVDKPRVGGFVDTVSVPDNVQRKYTHMGELDWASVQAFTGFSAALSDKKPGSGLVLAAMENDGTKYRCGASLAFWDDMSGLCPEASSPLLYPAEYLGGPPCSQLGTLYAQRSCPWVALNTWDGLLYSAPFEPFTGPNGGILINAYDVNNRVPLTRGAVLNNPDQYRIPVELFDALDTDGDQVIWAYGFARAVELRHRVMDIQGAAFSNDGFLFLINNTQGRHGVWRFSVLSGALIDMIGVDRESSWQECEAVCLYGANAGYAPPSRKAGETFVCATVIEFEASMDIVWLKTMQLGRFVP
jgi:hypothetical protein